MTAIKMAAKGVSKTLNDNAPTILSAFAVGGVISTAVLAVKVTPEAHRVILDEEQLREHDDRPRLKNLEVVKLVWRPYLPAVLMGASTVAAIIAANRVSSKRASALAAAYTLSDRAYQEYKSKVVETIGKPAEEKIRAEVAKDRYAKDEVADKEVILVGNGEQLYYDSLSGRSFMSDRESIRAAMNDINAMINNDQYASVSDFYHKIGLASTSYSDEIGWNNANMLDVQFASILTAGVPCVSLEYTHSPVRDYDKIW